MAGPMSPNKPSILVWDLPVRVFHWLLALSFAGAYVTAESEVWRLVHVTLGYTVAGLVSFRLVWGLVGTRHARFSAFVRSPAAAWRYLRSLAAGLPEHHVGHNPAGALAIVGLLALAGLVTGSGWARYNEMGGEWLEELHEVAANGMLALVLLHIVGAVASSVVHHENLVRAMVTGHKAGDPAQGIRRAWWPVGVLVLAGVLGFWALQWTSAPAPLDGVAEAAPASEPGRSRAHPRGRDDDDD